LVGSSGRSINPAEGRAEVIAALDCPIVQQSQERYQIRFFARPDYSRKPLIARATRRITP
jgi:hypothetical protein